MKNSYFKNSIARSVALFVMLGISCGNVHTLSLRERARRLRASAQQQFARAKSRVSRVFGGKPSMAEEIHAAAEDTVWFGAARSGDLNTVTSMLNGGQSVDEQNAQGATALHLAVANHHVAIVATLLKRGADADALMGQSGMTPLHLAASLGFVDIASILVGHPNIDVNAQDKKGNTPLHLAAFLSNHQMVNLLRNNGANQFVQNNEGVSAQAATNMIKSTGAKSRFRRIIGRLGIGYLVFVIATLVTLDVLTRIASKGKASGPKLLLDALKAKNRARASQQEQARRQAAYGY